MQKSITSYKTLIQSVEKKKKKKIRSRGRSLIASLNCFGPGDVRTSESAARIAMRNFVRNILLMAAEDEFAVLAVSCEPPTRSLNLSTMVYLDYFFDFEHRRANKRDPPSSEKRNNEGFGSLLTSHRAPTVNGKHHRRCLSRLWPLQMNLLSNIWETDENLMSF